MSSPMRLALASVLRTTEAAWDANHSLGAQTLALHQSAQSHDTCLPYFLQRSLPVPLRPLS